MSVLTNSATFTIEPGSVSSVSVEITVLPVPVSTTLTTASSLGLQGRIVHPMLGSFAYQVKPDHWMNIDGDAIIAPVWSSTKTLTSSVNVLWPGNIRDVTVEERWDNNDLTMPISQLRMLLAIWMNPVDPATGYVQWWPNYLNLYGYNVIPMLITVGGQNIVLDDVINALDEFGNPDGWVDEAVIFTMKLVNKL